MMTSGPLRRRGIAGRGETVLGLSATRTRQRKHVRRLRKKNLRLERLLDESNIEREAATLTLECIEEECEYWRRLAFQMHGVDIAVVHDGSKSFGDIMALFPPCPPS
jgi:hypothetical protein